MVRCDECSDTGWIAGPRPCPKGCGGAEHAMTTDFRLMWAGVVPPGARNDDWKDPVKHAANVARNLAESKLEAEREQALRASGVEPCRCCGGYHD